MPKQADVSQEILTYLSLHPEGETGEEITDWWMRADKGHHATEEVRQALALLLEKGEIEEVRGKKRPVLYRIKR
ncbi:MAG: hypothetical protein K8I29_14745 [Alphaproteobacteria bacterium]|uniref:Uncharacterized protein n=1 Tax=Candidatus Nitrobium versatile TaxID=2884831 RepID=A0A953J6R2_9BACT|nr:hypothetical protein [Candidatus Nitrobium versatile]